MFGWSTKNEAQVAISEPTSEHQSEEDKRFYEEAMARQVDYNDALIHLVSQVGSLREKVDGLSKTHHKLLYPHP